MRSKLCDGGLVGGIVLCGGQSRRMGLSKANLPFVSQGSGASTLLAHVVGVLSEVVGPIVIVSAAGQVLPDLPESVLFAHDRNDARGPMEGLAAGMLRLQASADSNDSKDALEAVYVTGCDVPLLQVDFVRHMIGQLGTSDAIAVPRCERFYHPLAAVYRMSTLSTIQRLLAHDLLRTGYLFDQLPTNEVSTDSLRSVDPELASLENVNTPEQYLAILERCGQQPTTEVLGRFEALRASREGKLR